VSVASLRQRITVSEEIGPEKRRPQRTATPENRGIRSPELPEGGKVWNERNGTG
jgi:hypothetical protein